jgi:hypothetical protein
VPIQVLGGADSGSREVPIQVLGVPTQDFTAGSK